MMNDMELDMVTGGNKNEKICNEVSENKKVIDYAADMAYDVYRFFEYVLNR